MQDQTTNPNYPASRDEDLQQITKVLTLEVKKITLVLSVGFQP
jgi:hypothetical protein